MLHMMCKKYEGIVMPTFAALRAAVFSLSTKNLRGGGRISAPVDARESNDRTLELEIK